MTDSQDRSWYYSVAGSNERKGPVTAEELAILWRSGHLCENDLVWSQGMPDWATAESASSHFAPSGHVFKENTKQSIDLKVRSAQVPPNSISDESAYPRSCANCGTGFYSYWVQCSSCGKLPRVWRREWPNGYHQERAGDIAPGGRAHQYGPPSRRRLGRPLRRGSPDQRTRACARRKALFRLSRPQRGQVLHHHGMRSLRNHGPLARGILT